jgi:hypothetical protein
VPDELKGKKLTAVPALNVGPFAVRAEKHPFTVE